MFRQCIVGVLALAPFLQALLLDDRGFQFALEGFNAWVRAEFSIKLDSFPRQSSLEAVGRASLGSHLLRQLGLKKGFIEHPFSSGFFPGSAVRPS